MKKYNCPSCGAEVIFQSSITVNCICAYCRSLLVRRDVDVDAIGKMAQLPQDLSPFQLGTTGKFKNIPFTLIGRMKIGWQDGCWNEWFLLTDASQVKAWLAEAQGSLMMSFESKVSSGEAFGLWANKRAITTMDSMPPLGGSIFIHGVGYVVNDIKKTEYLGGEGELPCYAVTGRKTIYFDLIGKNGEFAGIEFGENSTLPRLFVGQYVDFDDLKFSNLRELPGWKLN